LTRFHYQEVSNNRKAQIEQNRKNIEAMLLNILDTFEMITPQLIKEYTRENECNLIFSPQLRSHCNQILNELVKTGFLTIKERLTNIRSEPIVYIRA